MREVHSPVRKKLMVQTCAAYMLVMATFRADEVAFRSLREQMPRQLLALGQLAPQMSHAHNLGLNPRAFPKVCTLETCLNGKMQHKNQLAGAYRTNPGLMMQSLTNYEGVDCHTCANQYSISTMHEQTLNKLEA